MILDLVDRIKKSKITMIGFDSEGEELTHKFLKFFSDFKIIEPQDLLSDSDYKESILLCDFSSGLRGSSLYDISTIRRSKLIQDTVRKMYSIDNNIIFLTRTYKSPNGDDFLMGNSILYASNLAIKFSSGKIFIAKDRYSGSNREIPYSELSRELRNLSIDKALDS